MQALRAVGQTAGMETLQARVKEHASWLEANTTRQLATYARFVAQRRAIDGGDAATAAEEEHEEIAMEVFGGAQPGSVALAAEQSDEDADAALEQRVRGVVRRRRRCQRRHTRPASLR